MPPQEQLEQIKLALVGSKPLKKGKPPHELNLHTLLMNAGNRTEAVLPQLLKLLIIHRNLPVSLPGNVRSMVSPNLARRIHTGEELLQDLLLGPKEGTLAIWTITGIHDDCKGKYSFPSFAPGLLECQLHVIPKPVKPVSQLQH